MRKALKIIFILLITAYFLITAIPIDIGVDIFYIRIVLLCLTIPYAVYEMIYLWRQDQLNDTDHFAYRVNFILLVLVLFLIVYGLKFLNS